jgi:hypothetical protein
LTGGYGWITDRGGTSRKEALGVELCRAVVLESTSRAARGRVDFKSGSVGLKGLV